MSDEYHYPQPEDDVLSVRVLRYRGVFYIRELTSTKKEVGHSPNCTTQLSVSQRSCAMPIQQMGFLSKLYCIGWKNGSLKCFPTPQHWLLSIFLYYRKGYLEGSKWRQHHRLATLAMEMKQQF